MPGQRRLETHIFKSLTLLYVQHIFIKKTCLPEYPDTQRRLAFARCKIPKFDLEEKKKKKLTDTCARTTSTHKSTGTEMKKRKRKRTRSSARSTSTGN